jgi:hypothetical protein
VRNINYLTIYFFEVAFIWGTKASKGCENYVDGPITPADLIYFRNLHNWGVNLVTDLSHTEPAFRPILSPAYRLV